MLEHKDWKFYPITYLSDTELTLRLKKLRAKIVYLRRWLREYKRLNKHFLQSQPKTGD